ncbi:hypothetical protein ACFOZ1_15290 [Gracilibacillus marinus]|uniref:Uncharacterized protein n=1 Tax=Gracilibacillus marinus TaxID=630535 RepID=A0ABV8VZ14_9BACI
MRNLKIVHITKLISDAHKKKEKDKAWEMWLSKYPKMDQSTFISFEDFYARLNATTIVMQAKESSGTISEQYNKLKPGGLK